MFSIWVCFQNPLWTEQSSFESKRLFGFQYVMLDSTSFMYRITFSLLLCRCEPVIVSVSKIFHEPVNKFEQNWFYTYTDKRMCVYLFQDGCHS